MKTTNHALQNAKAWLAKIKEQMVKLDRRNVSEEAREDAEREIQESILSVEVRSPWYTIGADEEAKKPGDFKILLSTGGPALRIVGELSQYGGPESASLEYQDWGIPWTPFQTTLAEDQILVRWCSVFYFGE